ncbi:MFS transporter [Streptomyces sp. 4R-3d]|uniref:MFS transporter n=1 Tax=Streptomyces sp. 4R-3d TaxID=2559605 RepID=UPI0010746E6B|nr:MFS transporter [Streptomyces sp. 4R-3d]TFI20881.1 MFS transporter [Streptomyces sp. 4R-3d]
MTGLQSVGSRTLTGPQLFLLGGSFLITLGSFAVLPYMSVLLHDRFGLGLGVVGAVLAVASLVQFSGGVVGAALAARIGLRATMLVALAVRTAGFAAFVPGLTRPVVAVAALFLVSCGAALYLPANKAYLVAGCGPERRPGLLAASGSAFNAGIALGPPAASPFVLTSPAGLFTGVAVLFALVGAGHVLLPSVADEGVGVKDTTVEDRTGEADGVAAGVAAGSGLPPFAFTVLAVYIFMFFQHYLALYAVPRTSTAFYGAVLMGYAILLVVAQPLLARRLAALPYATALRLGFGAMAAGTAVLALGGRAGIAVGAVLLCLGEIVLFLKNDLEALARSAAPSATVFGRQRLAAGLGAFAAAVVGGQLYGVAERAAAVPVFWLVVSAQAVVLPALLVVWARGSARRRAGDGPVAAHRPR